MKQLGNLAMVCVRRPDVLLQILNGQATVFIGRGSERKRMTTAWDDDEQVQKIIHELNFGKYAEQKTSEPAQEINTYLPLEDILQKHFGLKGPLCLKRPRDTGERTDHYTKAGYEAYGKLIEVIYDAAKLTEVDVNELVERLDQIEYDN